MGVYNPMAKMPKLCCECPSFWIGEFCDDVPCCEETGISMTISDAETKRHKDCPLVEIKVPHGRLADVSEDATYNARYDNFDDHHMIVAQLMLDDLPTVIEAEGKGESKDV